MFGERRWFDVAVVAALAVAAQVEATLSDGYPAVPETLLALALVLPLLWRRQYAELALLGVLAVAVCQRLLFGEIWDTGSSLAVPMVAVYSGAAFLRALRAVTGYVLAVATMALADIGDGSDFAFIALVFGAVWVAGRAVRRQRDLVDQVTDYAEQLEKVQAERERAAAAEERTRIARELHDVVAHCVSTVVVQAEAGQSLIGRDPARADEAFCSIQSSGRQALTELRRMLHVLRDEDADRSELGPAPSLARLEPLLGSFRATGLDVALTVTGEPRPLPPGVDLSAYRIVQEALTNTVRHADATRARVLLAWGPRELEITIADDGHGPNGTGPRTGHGLLGMQERVRMHGGTLDLAHDGGFVVRSRLPL